MITIFCLLLIGIIICMAIIFVVGYFEFKRYMKKNSIDDRINELEKKSTYVKLNHVSRSLTNAVICIEDHRFYSHKGIDIISLFRAVFYNIKNHKVAQGGSTITQQLCKNLLKDNSRTIRRKASEYYASKYVEKYYSKDKILELYLNMIYFGCGYYGIKDATVGYFKVSPALINFDQATLLAGVIQAPSIFNIKRCTEKELLRQRQVINSMIRQNVI